MEIKNCRRCGKIFQFNGNYICPACVRKEDEDFQTVKEYLRANPGATPIIVSEDTGVDIKTIDRFIRMGLLDSDEYQLADATLECENCGAPIKAGRFCDRCIAQLQRGFNKAIQGLEPEKPGKKEKDHPQERSILHTYSAILNRKR
jgi:flagellar operon protein (TIGR03826 family)